MSVTSGGTKLAWSKSEMAKPAGPERLAQIDTAWSYYTPKHPQYKHWRVVPWKSESILAATVNAAKSGESHG